MSARAPGARPCTWGGGFTLLECLLAMAVAVLLLGAALPALIHALTAEREALWRREAGLECRRQVARVWTEAKTAEAPDSDWRVEDAMLPGESPGDPAWRRIEVIHREEPWRRLALFLRPEAPPAAAFDSAPASP